jgi:hypothetical protein
MEPSKPSRQSKPEKNSPSTIKPRPKNPSKKAEKSKENSSNTKKKKAKNPKKLQQPLNSNEEMMHTIGEENPLRGCRKRFDPLHPQ